jgi:hypothetical protein
MEKPGAVNSLVGILCVCLCNQVLKKTNLIKFHSKNKCGIGKNSIKPRNLKTKENNK